jgi:hypothetical protein
VNGHIFSLISRYELHLDSERLDIWPDFEFSLIGLVALRFREARCMVIFLV